MSIPRLLRPGDKVALIAPAAYLTEDGLAHMQVASAILSDWGLQVVTQYDAEQKHLYLAGDDVHRAQQLSALFADADVKALFALRGGYGSSRLLPALGHASTAVDTYLVGFSDIVALHLGLAASGVCLRSVHGPAVASEAFVGDDKDAKANRDRLHRLLFSTQIGLRETLTVLKPGRAEGPITGGCLSVISSLLGTPFEPRFAGKILFLEDVGEKPYRIDRMLTQLRQSNALAGVKGIVFGDMHLCDDGSNDLADVINDVFKDSHFPIMLGFPAGHAARNLAFFYDQQALMNAHTGDFCLLDYDKSSGDSD